MGKLTDLNRLINVDEIKKYKNIFQSQNRIIRRATKKKKNQNKCNNKLKKIRNAEEQR